MPRWMVVIVICGVIGAGVEISGIGGMLPMHGLVPPPVPKAWAALPTTQRVDITLVASAGIVEALAVGLSQSEIALHKNGAIAFVDGRVVAVSAASARNLLRSLTWDGLPIDVRQVSAAKLDRFKAPAAAPLVWRAHRHFYGGLQTGRDFTVRYPAGVAASTAVAFLYLLVAGFNHLPRRTDVATVASPQPARWSRRPVEGPTRVVLVPDQATLEQVRVSIGEEHIVAACEHAFAFADGWILASRKGSVFELMIELGWTMRPLQMATRSELAAEGHSVSAVRDHDGSETLGLLEALHVCGPIAHATS